MTSGAPLSRMSLPAWLEHSLEAQHLEYELSVCRKRQCSPAQIAVSVMPVCITLADLQTLVTQT